MLEIFSATNTGLVREINEDAFAYTETPNGILCVVCDGMGGHSGGAEASTIAVNCIIQYLAKEVYTDIRQALIDALDFANLQIIGTASEHPELKGMGTTACILLVQDNCAWLAHIGDSRIYLYVAKKKCLYRLTKDHSYVQVLVDQGIIYEDEAEKHPNKNRILKALGMKETIEPEIVEEPVLAANGDIFLICSDGLSGMVPDKEMEKILANKTAIKTKETALMSAAKAAGGLDNITFQLVSVNNSPHKKSVFVNRSFSVNKKNKKQAFMKYALLITVSIIIILTGLLLFINTNILKDPADSTDTINQQDSIFQQDSTIDQINIINQKSDSI